MWSIQIALNIANNSPYELTSLQILETHIGRIYDSIERVSNENYKILNNILITNITGSDLMVELLNQIIVVHADYPDKLLAEIFETFSVFEIRLSKGKRSIIHMEALIMKLCYICYKLIYG